MKLALIGGKLSHSYSAVIHDIFFGMTGITGSYDLIEVPSLNKLSDRIDYFEKNNFTGINITIPYKKAILKYVDEISGEVKKLEAANTILFRDGNRFAYNTDYFGFKRTLEINNVTPEGEKWLVLGSGGGAKSVIAVLNDMGAEQVLVASTTQEGPGFIMYPQIKDLEGFSGVVNTTPLGMYPDIESSPVDMNALRQFKTAVDIVYNPLETRFLNFASIGGLKTVSGLYMLVAQAVKAQEIWNGREFGDEIINEIFMKVGDML